MFSRRADGGEGWRRVENNSQSQHLSSPPVSCSLLSLFKGPDRHGHDRFLIQHGDSERARLDWRQREMDFPPSSLQKRTLSMTAQTG